MTLLVCVMRVPAGKSSPLCVPKVASREPAGIDSCTSMRARLLTTHSAERLLLVACVKRVEGQRVHLQLNTYTMEDLSPPLVLC